MKKIIALCLGIVMLLSLFGCGKAQLPEDSLLVAEAKVLLEKSLVLNQLFFETGIPTKEGGMTEGNYTEADSDYLATLGFQKLGDIKAYMHTVFSDAATADFVRYAVDKRTDGTALVKPAYCYDLYSDNEDNPAFLCLMVSKEGVHQKTDSFVYDFDSIAVVQNKKQPTSATLTISATITDTETGKVQERQVSFRLVLEEDGWKLDNLTCLSYKEEQDKLEGLDEILKKV